MRQGINFEKHIKDYFLQSGYRHLSASSFDAKLCFDPHIFAEFVKKSQPQTWESLSMRYGESIVPELAKELHLAISNENLLHVIHNGFTIDSKNVHVAYFLPDVPTEGEIERYRQNIPTLTEDAKSLIDILLSLNGIPVATIEVKHCLPRQHRRMLFEHLFYSRLTDAPEIQLTLVHFLVTPHEVYMTTKLEGTNTRFLPFNQGYKGSAGNPPISDGYSTAYLWEEVLQPERLIELVQHFIKLEGVNLVFPRYHQLDSVLYLLKSSQRFRAGRNYLIQHSAGSGKTNSIAYLANRLINLHSHGQRVYDSVLVVTDRAVLNAQLQNKIVSFSHDTEKVVVIDKGSKQLARVIETGDRIIITTIQMYLHAINKIAELPERNYAVIADEAHSSQQGKISIKIKQKFGIVEDEEPDEILLSALLKFKQDNISYFAFTATPHDRTLEAFGTKIGDDPSFPAHLYSMRQAIQECYILNVMEGYKTYEDYRIENDLVDELDSDPDRRISQIAEIIVDHVTNNVVHRLGGHGKAMVVTDSRINALRYKKAIDGYIRRNSFKTLVAFSQVVDLDGEKYTEKGINGIPESKLPERFRSDEYRILIVASKYQTGFDEPLLTAMYVDKNLKGIQAVQTLSRLNRVHRNYPEKKPFILDFTKSKQDIVDAFDHYMCATPLSNATVIADIKKLQNKLDKIEIYEPDNVIRYAELHLKEEQTEQDRKEMEVIIQVGIAKFSELDDAKTRIEFRYALSGYTSRYAGVSQVLLIDERYLEALFHYGNALRPRLPSEEQLANVAEMDEVIAQLTLIQARVLMYLLDCQDGIFRRQDTANYACCSEITVRASINRLISIGFIGKPVKFVRGTFQGARFKIENHSLCKRFSQKMLEMGDGLFQSVDKLKPLGKLFPELFE